MVRDLLNPHMRMGVQLADVAMLGTLQLATLD
jgi:hypothetical protein